MKTIALFSLIVFAATVVSCSARQSPVSIHRSTAPPARLSDPPATPLRESPASVSIGALLATPAWFDGKLVRVVGFPTFSFDHCCLLFASEEARKFGIVANSVGLGLTVLATDASSAALPALREPLFATTTNPIDHLAAYRTLPAIVEGRFRVRESGIGGDIVQPSRFEPYSFRLTGEETIFNQGIGEVVDRTKP